MLKSSKIEHIFRSAAQYRKNILIFVNILNMYFFRENKIMLNADNGRASVKFSIHGARSLMNIRIISVYGDYQYNVDIANFNIYNTYWKLTD